ncbi:homing endonuclease associated repeat-containing protein [Solibacillus sp. FSL K6-1523]|uniref:homing endonuclease associated repeat-containing protein n=1 Tax=Solibacillus sp. FSL K6-1523 TaxID=2921471 RepID=UPI0030FC0DDD
MNTKHCRCCDTVKAQNDFNKNKIAHDGLQKYCRECTRKFSRQNKERKAALDGRTMKPYQEQKFAQISEEDLLDYLRKFTAENDRLPTTEDLENNPDYPCAYTYYRRFIYKSTKDKKVENWNAILNLAGIEIVDYFSLWHAWEYLVERSVQVFETDYIFQYLGISDDFRPDIVIPSKKLIIDAATSNYADNRKMKQFNNARKSIMQ